MPVSRSDFSLKYTDIERLQNSIAQIGHTSESVINEHLHNVTGEQMVEGITRYIPVSKKGKRHAKYNKWWEQSDYNLAVAIENSLKGKRGTSFYYLYYVITGTGTSYMYGKRDFMEQGLNKNYDKIVNSLFDELMKHIERGIQ